MCKRPQWEPSKRLALLNGAELAAVVTQVGGTVLAERSRFVTEPVVALRAACAGDLFATALRAGTGMLRRFVVIGADLSPADEALLRRCIPAVRPCTPSTGTEVPAVMSWA